MEVVNLSESQPFTTKDGSTIRKLLEPSNSSIKNQSLAEASLPPYFSTTPHYHIKSEEIYFILEGEGLIKIENEEQMVKKNDAIFIPPGKIHTIKNTSPDTLRFLCTCSPAYSHEDTIICEGNEK